MKKIVALVLLSLFVSTPAAFAAPTFSADVEINTTFDSKSDGSTISTMDMGGRVLFTAESKLENKDTGFFVAGKGQVLANLDGTASVDDAWGQFGNKSFDLKVGRFEAESLLDAGEDIYVASAGGQWYTANNARGRNNGGMALTFNVMEGMMFQVGAIYGNKTSKFSFPGTTSTVSLAENKFGVRPLIKYSTKDFTVVAGLDYYGEAPQNKDIDGSTTKIGFGGQVTGSFSGIKINVGAASGTTQDKDYTVAVKDSTTGVTTIYTVDDTKETITTIKGYANIPVGTNLIGLGVGYSSAKEADVKETYGFACYEMKLPVEGAWLKFAASYAKVKDGDSDVGGRVRLNYTF